MCDCDVPLVFNTCCPDGMPSILFDTMTGIYSGTVQLDYDATIGTSGAWRGSFNTIHLGMPVYTCKNVLTLICFSVGPGLNFWALSLSQDTTSHSNCAACIDSAAAFAETGCNPFMATAFMGGIPATCPWNTTGSVGSINHTITS